LPFNYPVLNGLGNTTSAGAKAVVELKGGNETIPSTRVWSFLNWVYFLSMTVL